MAKYRIEKDSMGEVSVPESALYGAQTQRAVENFQISGQRMPEEFLRALIAIKLAAAQANETLEVIATPVGQAIEYACEALLSESSSLDQHFPVDVFQTGSGTSTNMNANEVIAHLASRQAGISIHPNDHVNASQSSNDTIPTAIHVAATLALQRRLLPSLIKLAGVIEKRSAELNAVVKTGRTHLMDAMPLTLGQALSGWHSQVMQNIDELIRYLPSLQKLPQGGTAVGTGINAHPKFAETFNAQLSAITGVGFYPADNYFALIAAQDIAVGLSARLKTLAVSLMKIANDLRWMNSGPLCGLGEIQLRSLQPGSSIMPGKVNPVIPEAVAMVAAQVIGNDTTITVAGQSGNFELNVTLPVIALNLLSSIQLLSNAADHLATKAIADFQVNSEKIAENLTRNPILATALNPQIGYSKAAEIAKRAYREQKPVIDVAEQETDIARNELAKLLDPKRMT